MPPASIKSPKSKFKPKRVPNHNLNSGLFFGAVGAIVIILICQLYINSNSFRGILSLNHAQKPLNYDAKTIIEDLDSAVKPFENVEFSMEQIFENQEPVWGTLNGGHYFGMKLSSPNTIETSMMWFKNELNGDGRLNIRHLCNQNDGLKSYGWTKHDFHNFGIQNIDDDNYRITTSFVKNPTDQNDWKARIKLDFLNSSLPMKPLSIIQYITTNHNKDQIQLKSSVENTGQLDNSVVVEGMAKDVGPFLFEITWSADSESKPLYTTCLSDLMDKSRRLPSPFLESKMRHKKVNGSYIIVLPNSPKIAKHDKSHLTNIIACQIVVDKPVTIELYFYKHGKPNVRNWDFKFDFDKAIEKKIQEFDDKFSMIFPMFNVTDRDIGLIDNLAKTALSNMIGSVSYFHGYSSISSSLNPKQIAAYGPIQLLSAVPSRSFFPRGFLWDEGFHNLLIGRWDPGLSNKIIKSWFNIMNIHGWIPREVILGVESMSRVPYEFMVQKISNANPPAMLLAIEYLSKEGLLEDETLRIIYPRLKLWYRWFNITQSSDKPSTFRWRGRDQLSVQMLNPKTLTSGFDDYPRASHPSDQEYHVDLRCWMALAARVLSKLSRGQGLDGDQQFLDQISMEAKQLHDNELLDQLHWSDEHKMYCDYGHNTEKSELVRVVKQRKSAIDGSIETYRVLERQSTGQPVFGGVPEFGYVSLFPMILNIVDAKSDKLGHILDMMHDEKKLWSPYGVRSLSKSSKYYNKYNTEHDKPYWRGAVWLNINYLILSSLKSYSSIEGPHRERCAKIFAELSRNLVNNVIEEFSRTNYLWENYDDVTGRGQGSHPFTGWSSLIVLIMSSGLS